MQVPEEAVTIVVQPSDYPFTHLHNEIRENPTLNIYDRDLYWFIASRPDDWTSNSKAIAEYLNRTDNQITESYSKLRTILNAVGEPF